MRSSQFSISFSQLLMRCSYSMISCLLLCSSADRSSNSEAKSLALSDQDSSQSQSYLFWADRSRQRVLRWSLSPQRMMVFKSSFSFYVSNCFILNCTFVQFSQRCSLSVQLGCSLSKNSEMSTWVSISSLGGCSDRRCSISAFNYWFSAVSILMEWMCSWFSSMNILTLSNISCLSSQMSAGMIQHWHSMLMFFSTCSSRWISARMSPFLSSALTLLREISLLSSSILDLYMSIISMHSRSSLLYLLWYSSSFSLNSCSLLSISSFSCLTISSYLANFQLSLISGLIVCSVCELWSYFRGSSRDSSMMLLSISRLRLILSTICLISKTEEQPWNLSSSTDSGLSLKRVVSSIIFSSLVFSLLNISLLSLAAICTFSFSLAFSIASRCSLFSLSPLALAVSFCFSATSLFRTQF